MPCSTPPTDQTQLKRDLCTYYDYNAFMVDALLAMFSVGEALELIEAQEVRWGQLCGKCVCWLG